ncbi:hypothetical protein PCE1_004435 [Barthelona sp. PCE]
MRKRKQSFAFANLDFSGVHVHSNPRSKHKSSIKERISPYYQLPCGLPCCEHYELFSSNKAQQIQSLFPGILRKSSVSRSEFDRLASYSPSELDVIIMEAFELHGSPISYHALLSYIYRNLHRLRKKMMSSPELSLLEVCTDMLYPFAGLPRVSQSVPNWFTITPIPEEFNGKQFRVTLPFDRNAFVLTDYLDEIELTNAQLAVIYAIQRCDNEAGSPTQIAAILQEFLPKSKKFDVYDKPVVRARLLVEHVLKSKYLGKSLFSRYKKKRSLYTISPATRRRSAREDDYSTFDEYDDGTRSRPLSRSLSRASRQPIEYDEL